MCYHRSVFIFNIFAKKDYYFIEFILYTLIYISVITYPWIYDHYLSFVNEIYGHNRQL